MGAKQGRTKGNEQKAEYENLENWNERSCQKERGNQRSENGSGQRENHCEVEPVEKERKKQRPSSKVLKLKREKAKDKHLSRKRNQKGITCGTAAGAKQDRTKGNGQRAEYGNREGMHERSGRIERGKHKKRKQKMSTETAAVRQEQEDAEREKQKAE